MKMYDLGTTLFIVTMAALLVAGTMFVVEKFAYDDRLYMTDPGKEVVDEDVPKVIENENHRPELLDWSAVAA